MEKRLAYDEYYSRQTVLKELGKKGQQKLAGSKVAVVGLGGLGTVSSLYLALAGVGHLRLIDQDTVETANLHRQVLYTPKDLLYPKAEASARRLNETCPFVNVEPVSENVNAGNVEKLLFGMDCVVDGLDNLATRYLINRVCAKHHIPYVFGAAIGLEGNLSVFAPPETPCLECVFPNVNDDVVSSCDVRGVLGATAGIIGTLQGMETIKLLAKIGLTLKGKLMICDFSDMYFATIDISKRDDCTVCQKGHYRPDAKENLTWLCGKNTININPVKPLKLNLQQICSSIKPPFRVRVKTQIAMVFDYKNFEATLFSNGRMLIKNIDDENSALATYKEILKQLKIGK